MCGSISQDEKDMTEFTFMGKQVVGLATAAAAPKPLMSFVLGRFQPLHLGHVDLIEAALAAGEKTVIMIGSATESRSLDNPFTYEERRQLIADHFVKEVADGKLVFEPVRDMKYRDADWEKHVASIVSKRATYRYTPVVFGMEKDTETTDCLDIFRKHFDVRLSAQKRVLNATDIRDEFFSPFGDIEVHKGDVSKGIWDFLTEFERSKEFSRLQAEYNSVKKQQKINAEIARINGGFQPVYVAVDNLALWIDHWGKPHLQVVTRKGEIGKGKYALVGGYVDGGKDTILAACKHENLDEAGHDLTGFTLSGVEVFDSPKRSKRGHMITHVHHWYIKSPTPPKLTPDGVETETAQWIPLDQIAGLQHLFFADHYHIIAKMLPVVELFN